MILAICITIAIALIGVAVDITCYFTHKRGLLNTIINRQIPEGAQQIGSGSEDSSTDEDAQTEKCLPDRYVFENSELQLPSIYFEDDAPVQIKPCLFYRDNFFLNQE
jgi:hypothetical protein